MTRRALPLALALDLCLMVWAMTVAAVVPAGATTTQATVRVLASLAGGPDDLALGPGGSLYLSLIHAGTVVQLLGSGRRRVVARGLALPEGIVVLAGGSLLVGEQGRNRVVRVDPRSGATHPFVTVPNLTGRDGLDGLAGDPRDGALLVPDAPHGRLLRVSRDGRRMRVLATGLGRPVGVALDPRGRPVVVDEHLNGAFLVDARGRARRLGGALSVPDDIVADGAGGFYVTCLGDGTLRHVAGDGATTLVAAGLPNPQGLARRPDGTLIVTEEDAGRVVAVSPGP